MIIFLHGPDTFRSRRALNDLKARFSQTNENAGLNTTVLYGETVDAVAFERAVSTPPFLAKKRLVIVERLLEKNRGKKIISDVLGLLPRVDQQTTVLIFWEGELPSGRRGGKTTQSSDALLTKLQKADKVQAFGLLEPSAVQQWIRTEVTSRQAAFAPAAVALLADSVGNDLWQLNGEIDKLIAYRAGGEVTVRDVETLVQTKLDDDVFKLTDAIGRRQKAIALRLLTEQLQSGTSPTQLLASITWQFRNLLLVKLLLNEPGPAGSRSAQQLGLHPFVVKKTTSQASHYQLDDLKKIYSRLSSIEHKIKTSRAAPEVLLNLLVVAS